MSTLDNKKCTQLKKILKIDESESLHVMFIKKKIIIILFLPLSASPAKFSIIFLKKWHWSSKGNSKTDQQFFQSNFMNFCLHCRSFMAIISDLSARQWKRFKEEKGERESVEGKKRGDGIKERNTNCRMKARQSESQGEEENV